MWRITPDGDVSIYPKGSAGDPIRTPNDPAFDALGNLYVSDSGEWKQDNGRLFKIRPGGETEVWRQSPTEFPNGLALGPEGDFLYVVVSTNPPRVERLKMESDGRAGEGGDCGTSAGDGAGRAGF